MQTLSYIFRLSNYFLNRIIGLIMICFFIYVIIPTLLSMMILLIFSLAECALLFTIYLIICQDRLAITEIRVEAELTGYILGEALLFYYDDKKSISLNIKLYINIF